MYQYSTTTVSAIPELNSDFTGLGVRGKLVIEVGPHGRKVVCQIKNPEVGHPSDEVTRESSRDDWKRQVRLSWASMPPKAAEPLTRPFLVKIANGVVSKI